MSRLARTSAAAVGIAIVFGSGHAIGQGQVKNAGQILPAILQLLWETEERPVDASTVVETLVAEARTVTILGAALQSHPEIIQQLEPARRKDVLRWMTEVVRIEALPGTDLIQVTCDAPTPKLAATVANAVADALIKNSFDARLEHLDLQYRMKEEESLAARHRASKLRSALQDRMRSAGDDFGLPTMLALSVDELRETRSELRRVRLEKAAAEVRLDRMTKRPTPSDIPGLSDAVAVLGAQEQLLVKTEQAGVEAIRRAEIARVDSEAAQDELAHAEERVRGLDEELRRKKSAMVARGIRKFSQAGPAGD